MILQTKSYNNKTKVTIVEPNNTSTLHSGFSTKSYNTIGTYTTTNTYTITYGDSYGDGYNPSTYYNAYFVQTNYQYISGTTVPSITTYNTSIDSDDDNNGYSNLDENDTYDTTTTTLYDDGSAYTSSNNSLDASNTPTNINGDLTCDALNTDHNNDDYTNAADDFPDDINE